MRADWTWRDKLPLEILRLTANPAVQEMTPAARAGLIWLMMAQWRSPNGYLPTDDAKLRTLSGLRDEWPANRDAIMRQFVSIGAVQRTGGLGTCNMTLRRMWEATLEKHEAFFAGGKQSGAKRRELSIQLRASSSRVSGKDKSSLQLTDHKKNSPQNIIEQDHPKASLTSHKLASGAENAFKTIPITENTPNVPASALAEHNSACHAPATPSEGESGGGVARPNLDGEHLEAPTTPDSVETDDFFAAARIRVNRPAVKSGGPRWR